MGVDHPGGPGEGPEPTDKPTPPSTGDEPPAPPGADGKTPRKDSLKAAGWQFDDQQEPGTDDNGGKTNDSSADPTGEAKPEAEEKSETGKPEADEPRPAGGTQETPRTQPADETTPQPPREQDGEGVGSTGHTDAGPPSRPQDNSTPGEDPTDQPPGGEAPAVTDKGSAVTDTGDPKPAEPANQDTPLPEPHAVDSDKPPAEGTGSGNEADGERGGKPVAPQPENTSDKPDTTDKVDPGQLERTPYTDNPGSGTQPSRIATLIAAGWEFPDRPDNGSQPPETTDPKPEDTPKTDASDPDPQTPETPPPSEEPQPTDKPADTDPPPQPEQTGGPPEEPVDPKEVPGDAQPPLPESAADRTPPADDQVPDEESKTQPADEEPTDAPPAQPEVDAPAKEGSVVDEEPRDGASESAEPEGPEPPSEPSGEIEEKQAADAADVPVTERLLETSDEADEELEAGEQVEPLTDAEYGDRVREVAAKLDDAHAQGMATDHTHTLDAKRSIWSGERDQIHDEIIADLYARAKDVPNDGQAVIAGGLGGAGKSTVLENYAGIDQSRYLTINPDDIKEEMAQRDLIPEVEGLSPMEASSLVHEESSHIAKRLSGLAASDGKNVIWDITMASPESTERRIESLRSAGYTDVKGVFVDIPVGTSVARAQARHRRGLEGYRRGEGEGGRYVPEAVIRSNEDSEWGSTNRKTFEHVKDKFDEWSIYDNSVDGRAPVLVDSSDKDDENRE